MKRLVEVVNDQINFQVKAKRIDYKRLICRIESSYIAHLDVCIKRVIDDDEVIGAELIRSIDAAIEKDVNENPIFIFMKEMDMVDFGE